MSREFFNCDCHTEGLIVENIEGDTYISLWAYGQSGNRMAFWNRIRWCWSILKIGLPWTDCVILHPKEVERLINVLQNQGRK